MRTLLGLLVGTLLWGCGAAPGGPGNVAAASDPSPWVARLDRDHPLVGKVWHTDRGEFLPWPALIDQLAQADVVLLGEKHDHPDHHRLQADVLRALVARGRRPALRMEMLSPEQEAEIARLRPQFRGDALGLLKALGWDKTGWPDAAMYAPIVQVALDADLPLGPANLGREQARAIARQGPAALDEATRQRLALHLALDPSAVAAQEQEVIDSHCGHLPAEAAVPMALAQRARDAAMAEAILRDAQAPTPRPVVLIAGGGHVRRDRAVPWWLRQRAPGLRVVAVVPVQVRQDTQPRLVAEEAAAEVVLFTPRLDDVDPCARFRQQLETLKDRGRSQ